MTPQDCYQAVVADETYTILLIRESELDISNDLLLSAIKVHIDVLSYEGGVLKRIPSEDISQGHHVRKKHRFAVALVSGAFANPVDLPTGQPTTSSAVSSAVPSVIAQEQAVNPSANVTGAKYKCYKLVSDFPSEETRKAWPFETLWSTYQPTLQYLNNAQEIKDLHDSILTASQNSSLESTWIFALVLQEGNANVHNPDRVEADGSVAYGITQSHLKTSPDFPAVHCTDPSEAADKAGCPRNKIQKMLEFGVFGQTNLGTPLGHRFYSPGLGYCLQKFKTLPLAFKCYNSGQNFQDLTDTTVTSATKTYVSDIGNWLTGVNVYDPQSGHPSAC